MAIHPKTIYSKTPKGVLEIKNKTSKLPREAGMVFLAVDGKSTAADLQKKSGMEEKKLHDTLEKLAADGFIRIFTVPEPPRGTSAATVAVGSVPGPGVEDDLDFTSPTAMSKLNAEATSRAKAESDAKARALAAARAAAEAKVRQETESRARVQAEAKAQVETDAKNRAEAAGRAAAEARAKAEGEARAAADARARAEAEARVKVAMEAKARADAEAKSRAEAETRARAEAERKVAAEARAKAEAEARARAEVDARAHAEAETRAKAAVEAQMKALQDALAQAEKRAKQEAEERKRVEIEIKARQESERKAREEAEARAKAAEEAVGQARAMAEEAARARAAAEAKAALDAVGGGGEAARQHMETTLKALEEAKAKARAEAEARADAERRAKSEAEARVREEKERKLRDEKERKEREEADARTKVQLRELQEQARRAKEEAEAKAAIERKAREEAEARVEAERRGREEAERKAAAEAKAREEALAKAKIEAEAKARSEVEAMIQAERKAREEAERKARELDRSGDHSPAARKARAEVEEMARKAEEAVAQARAQVEEERKARAAAEDRAKMEAVARVMQEQQLRSGAEEEIKARVQAEIKARELAEAEAESRYRQEAAARAKAAAEERRKRDAGVKEGKPIRIIRPTNWSRTIGVSAAVLLAVAVGLLHVVPLNNFIGGAQRLMTQRLGVPVTITNLRYALLPLPELTLERVGVGKLQEVKIQSIVVSAWPWTLFGDTMEFDNVELNSLTTDQESLALLPAWVRPQAGAQPLNVRRVQLIAAKVTVKNLDTPIFNGDITLGPDGALQRAVLSDSKSRFELTPRDGAMRVALEARGWRLPLGPTLEFDDLVMEAIVEPQQASVTAFTGKVGRATIKGSARASWGSGVRVEGDLAVTNGELAQLMANFTRDFSATGTLTANITYALEGTNLQNLFADPRVEASFNVEKGSLNNIDIVRAIQSPSRDGVRGGKTGFNSLAGSMRLVNRGYSYRQLQLSSGPMIASGNVDVAPDGALSGRISTQLGSKTVIVARGNLVVTGNLKTPVLK